MNSSKNIAVLGSTGSVGQSALEVIRAVDEFQLIAISGHGNRSLLLEQAAEFRPNYVVISQPDGWDHSTLPHIEGTEFLFGQEGLQQIASLPEVDTVLAAIVGIAGLPSTLTAVAEGKRIALANKESLVVAGHLITRSAAASGAPILPVDSEHSAIFQALQCGTPEQIHRVTLTASGGPFREMSVSEMKAVTVAQALSHPTWNMGKKISVDSATMMNKGLELIEAKWLFDLSIDQLNVVIHPQSIVHSMVEFIDGSSIAQMSLPDMMLPIQYAFSFPRRVTGPSPKFDWTRPLGLEFFPPDRDRFPALDLGFEVAASGGTAGAVLNAANEAAVEAFLQNKIKFTDIALACREVLAHHHFEPCPKLPELIQADQWARQEIAKWMIV